MKFSTAQRYGSERGVHWDARRGKWVMRITIRGVRQPARFFESKDAALVARDMAIGYAE